MKNWWSKLSQQETIKSVLMLAPFLSTAIVSATNNTAFNCVEHKNSQLNLYLDFIRYNCQEKIGILPHILKHPQGTYLEIGTGGDPIVQMLSKIPPTANATIIASDIDADILKSLPKRHPQLARYLNAKDGPTLALQELNAVDMHIFKNESLDGINASSVLHEIFSYELGYVGIEKFIKEAFRTLKVGGILAYRDPEGVADRTSMVCIDLKTKSIRLFTHIFLYKFIDHRGSRLAQAHRKMQLYAKSDVTFCVYKKNDAQPTTLSYDEYLAVPSYDIDFSRSFAITLPLGLYQELARHYLTYLHQCNPLVFVRCMPNLHSSLYTINFFAHSTPEILKRFLSKYDWKLDGHTVTLEQKNKIEATIAETAMVLEFGIPLHFTSRIKETQLHNVLTKYGFSPSTHIIALNNGNCLLDYRVFGMLYDELTDRLFDDCNGSLHSSDEIHAQWLKREGEEYYFYYSEDELLTNMAKITYLESIDDSNTYDEAYVLCPITENNSTFIHRICYSELLTTALEVNDSLGYPIEVKDGKRIIHFCKMKLAHALEIYQKIINLDPLRYPNLQKFVRTMQAKTPQLKENA